MPDASGGCAFHAKKGENNTNANAQLDSQLTEAFELPIAA